MNMWTRPAEYYWGAGLYRVPVGLGNIIICHSQSAGALSHLAAGSPAPRKPHPLCGLSDPFRWRTPPAFPLYRSPAGRFFPRGAIRKLPGEALITSAGSLPPLGNKQTVSEESKTGGTGVPPVERRAPALAESVPKRARRPLPLINC